MNTDEAKRLGFPINVGETEPRYIGDGVYVTTDGYQIWLRTPRDNGWHEIALDHYTFDALVKYRKDIESMNTAPAVGRNR